MASHLKTISCTCLTRWKRPVVHGDNKDWKKSGKSLNKSKMLETRSKCPFTGKRQLGLTSWETKEYFKSVCFSSTLVKRLTEVQMKLPQRPDDEFQLRAPALGSSSGPTERRHGPSLVPIRGHHLLSLQKQGHFVPVHSGAWRIRGHCAVVPDVQVQPHHPNISWDSSSSGVEGKKYHPNRGKDPCDKAPFITRSAERIPDASPAPRPSPGSYPVSVTLPPSLPAYRGRNSFRRKAEINKNTAMRKSCISEKKQNHAMIIRFQMSSTRAEGKGAYRLHIPT